MDSPNFQYDDPYTLNKFLDQIPEEKTNLTVVLRPDVDRIIRAADAQSGLVASSPIPEIDATLQRNRLASDQLIDLYTNPLWEEHNVLPFWEIVFTYIYGSNMTSAEIKYTGTSREKHTDPTIFANPKKWFGVCLDDHRNFARSSNTSRIKNDAKKYTKNGYRVTRINIRDNLNQKGDSDATLFAHKGKIEIYGTKPDRLSEIVRDFLT